MNITKTLIDDYHKPKAWIMLHTGASEKTIENWYNGGQPLPVFQNILEKLLKRAEKNSTTVATLNKMAR